MVKIADHSTVIYGTHFPNRIFVGCLPPKATAQDLADFFRYFGAVNEAKVVLDENGGSKRFGFVSFGKEEDVKNVLQQGSIFFWGKKINVGPAVKKKFYDDVKGQPATLVFDQDTINTSSKSRVIYQPMESLQLHTANTTSSHLTMKFQPWPYIQVKNNHQPSMPENLNGMYQMPYCTTLQAVPGPIPSLLPNHPYQIAQQVISDPNLVCPYTMPIHSSPVCGKHSGSVSVNPNCISPMANLNSSLNDPVKYAVRKVIAKTHN